MDVALVFDQQERQFLLPFKGASGQIPIELVREELLQCSSPRLFLHQRERRVVREPFGEPGRPLHVSTDQLMPPPLVRHLVCCHVERQIQIAIAIPSAEDESNTLGKWNGIRECLRELRIARKLDDANLPELIGTEVGSEVIERGLHRGHHAVEVILVAGMIINLELDAFVLLAFHQIPG